MTCNIWVYQKVGVSVCTGDIEIDICLRLAIYVMRKTRRYQRYYTLLHVTAKVLVDFALPAGW